MNRKLQTREAVQRYRQRHPDRIKAYYKRSKQKVAEYQRQVLYGLTPKQYKALLGLQNNACAICVVSFEEKKAYVDHDHITNKVRGLLCNRCNILLAPFEDSLWAAKAKQYLEDRQI